MKNALAVALAVLAFAFAFGLERAHAADAPASASSAPAPCARWDIRKQTFDLRTVSVGGSAAAKSDDLASTSDGWEPFAVAPHPNGSTLLLMKRCAR